jgi:hypothetical protein
MAQNRHDLPKMKFSAIFADLLHKPVYLLLYYAMVSKWGNPTH